MTRNGRPTKPHHPSWGGDPIPGLYKIPGGNQWRIVATGKKFRESDERRAVEKFMAQQPPQGTIAITSDHNAPFPTPLPISTANGAELPEGIFDSLASDPNLPDGTKLKIGVKVNELAFWNAVREQIMTRRDYVAKMTGIPEIAWLHELKAPVSIKLSALTANYEKNSITKKGIRQAVRIFERLAEFANATTTEDLTQEQFMKWREHCEQEFNPQTRSYYYGAVRAILFYGKKRGMDSACLDACLSRAEVLDVEEAMNRNRPNPISPPDFRKLLAAATGKNKPWRKWLLLGLNLCSSIDEICDLKWDDFNFEKGFYYMIRNKSKKDSVPRAATLWPETLAELKAIPKRNEYVLLSKYGTRYSSNSRCSDFTAFALAAGVPVTFSQLRDGAYGVACENSVDERLGRLLAGHSAPGYEDRYVSRNPRQVQPACEKVYNEYMILEK